MIRCLNYSNIYHTCMCTCMSFEIKGVIEALPTESAEVSLDFTVALQMAVEETLELERLLTNPANVIVLLGTIT